MNRKRKAEEQKECEYFHEWLCIKKIRHHHSPNGELRYRKRLPSGKVICPDGIKLKKMGTSAGFPDFFIPYASKDYHGLFIEMKKREGGKLSMPQNEWLYFLISQGYLAVMCEGWIQASKIVENYFQ